MVKAFGSRLSDGLSHLSLPPAILRQLHADEIKLAGMQAPAGLVPSTQTAIKESIAAAFVFGFRIVILLCACLSLASAAVAWLVMPKERKSE